MSAPDNNKPPPYADVPPGNTAVNTNPYHAGYDQHGNQGFYAPQQGMPMQPGPAGQMMTSNTVVVTQQPAAYVIGRSRGSDLTIPAILVCFFCCWCSGIPAIIYASKAQNEYGAGNWEEAESNQRTARGWIIGSVVSHVVLWGIFLVIYFVAFAAASNEYNKY